MRSIEGERLRDVLEAPRHDAMPPQATPRHRHRLLLQIPRTLASGWLKVIIAGTIGWLVGRAV